MSLLLTTTGLIPIVTVEDLGERVFTHPTVNFNLMTEFLEDELQGSADLQAHIVAGNVTITDGNGNPITDLSNAGPHEHFANNITDFDAEVQNNPDVATNTTHRGRVDNPHGVSPAQISAAPTVHTHIASDVTDFDAEVQNNPDVATNTTHRGRVDNPHTVTKSQVSLGNVTDDAQLKRAAGDFASFAPKGAPVVNDLLLIEDSQDVSNKKRILIDDIPYLYGVDNDKVIYVGKHGNDANDGETTEKAVLTFGRAIILVNAQVPAAGNTWCIRCADAGQYTENLTFPTWTCIDARSAVLIGNHTVQDYTSLCAGILSASSGVCVTKSAGTTHSWINWGLMSLTGGASGILCTSGELQVDGRVIEVQNGYGIGTISTQEIHGELGHIEISGTGIGVGAAAAGAILSLQINCIHGSGTAIYVGNGSILNLDVQRIDSTGIAYNIIAGGELNLFVATITGTETSNGILNLTKAGCVGGWNASSVGVSSTTATAYQQKLRLNLVNLPAGTYVIHWSAQIVHSDTNTNRRTRARVELDDTSELGAMETKWNFPAMFSGTAAVPLTAGNHTVDIDYSRVGTSATASISQARIFVQRVN